MLPTIWGLAMSDRTRIGPAVDAKLWERFRQDVKSRKGTIRGNLGNELDKALREYLNDETNPTERRIDQRLSRIEEAVGIATADGGVDTSQSDSHTHAPPEPDAAPAEKPAANAATDKKIAWLSEQLIQQEVPNSRDLTEVPRDAVRELVVTEYGFRKDTAKRYVEMLQDEFDLVTHPQNDKVLMTQDRREELIRERMEDNDD